MCMRALLCISECGVCCVLRARTLQVSMHVAKALGAAFKQYEFENPGPSQSASYFSKLLSRYRMNAAEAASAVNDFKTWSSLFDTVLEASVSTGGALDALLPVF